MNDYDAGAMTNAVVVPAISAGSSVTTIRSLGRRGVRTIALGTDSSVPAFRSNYCDETFVAPDPDEDPVGYRDALLTLASRSDVVTIVPLRESDIYVLAKDRDAFGEQITTPWMPFHDVRDTQDWLRLKEAAEDADIETPETGSLDEWDDWNRPAVIKSRYSIVERDGRLISPGMRFVDSGSDPDVEAIVSEMGHVPIVQEYVPGDAECGFFGLFDSGSLVATFQHRRIRSYTYAGGASVYRKSIDDDDLFDAGSRLLQSLDWHGPAMAEFKHDPRDDSYKLIEINPRFWGSLALPVHAGIDFPYLYYRLAVGDEISRENEYDVGVGSHLLRGEMSYVHSILRHDFNVAERPPLEGALGSLLTSLVTQPRFDLLSLDDPWPFLADFLGTSKTDVLDPLVARI